MAQSLEKIERFIIANIRPIMQDIQNLLDEYVCDSDCDQCKYSNLCKDSDSRW